MPTKTVTKPITARSQGTTPKAGRTKIDFLKERFVTCPGRAKYAYLNQPDDSFGQAVHKIQIHFDTKTPEFKTFAAAMVKAGNELLERNGKKPVKTPSFFKTDKEGSTYIQFKTTPKKDDNGNVIPVTVVDASKEACDTRQAWGGSLIKVAFGLGYMDTKIFTGIKPYLNAVQVLESTYEPAARGASAFEIEGDYIQSDGDELPDNDEATDGDDTEGEVF